MSKFRRGTIAINECGDLGVIQTIGTEWCGPVYGGVSLRERSLGHPWGSDHPKFVCHVDDLTKRFDGDTFLIEPTGPEVRTYPHGLSPCPALSAPVVVDSPLRDDDPVHDCSEGVISHSPVVSRPARRSCI